jgi:hypothetical protein
MLATARVHRPGHDLAIRLREDSFAERLERGLYAGSTVQIVDLGKEVKPFLPGGRG